MHAFRRLLNYCWVGIGIGLSLGSAQAQTGAALSPAARAQIELERQAQEFWQHRGAQEKSGGAAVQNAIERESRENADRAKAVARKARAAESAQPAASARYAAPAAVQQVSNATGERSPEAAALDVERAARLARIEKEIERQRASMRGEKLVDRSASTKAAEVVSPVPPASPATPEPIAKAKSSEVRKMEVAQASRPSISPADEQRSRELLRQASKDLEDAKGATRIPVTTPKGMTSAERLAAERARLAAEREAREQLRPLKKILVNAPPPQPSPAKVTAEQDRLARQKAEEARRAEIQARKAQEELERTARLKKIEAEVAERQRARTASPAAAANLSPARAPGAAPVTAVKIPGQTLSEDRRSRELLRQTLQSLDAESASPEASAQAERMARRQAEQARRDAEAQAKAQARSEAAEVRRQSVRKDAAPVPAPAPAPAPAAVLSPMPKSASAATAFPAGPRSKANKLSDLLKAYTRSDSAISAEEYHRERARILAEPGQ